MPITQSRVIAILNAAQDYEQALSRAVALIRTHAAQANDGTITWQQAMETTVILVSAGALLTRVITTNKTLAAERQHFKDFARRNESAAQRQALKRGPTRAPKRQRQGLHQDYLEFVPTRTTAPAEITKEGRLYGSLLDDVDEAAGAKYAPDPSLGEDDDWQPPEASPDQGQSSQAQPKLIPGSLDPETRERIEREAEAAVASHPGLTVDLPEVVSPDGSPDGTEEE